MKGVVALASIILLLTGCSSTQNEPTTTLTQHDCLERGQFKFGTMCVNWSDLPDEETQAQVIDEIATEIAISRGISKEQALKEVYNILEK